MTGINQKGFIPCGLCDSAPENHLHLLSAPLQRSLRPYFANQVKTSFVICPTCGLIFLSPRPSKDCFVSFYERNNRKPENYKKILDSESCHVWYHNKTISFLKQHIHLPETPKIIDIGCGYGSLLKFLSLTWPGKTVGIEPSNEAIRFIKSTYGYEIYQCALEEMPELGTFDLITCVSVLEHMFDPTRGLRLMADLLAPGGYLFISVPDIEVINFSPLKGVRIQNIFKIVHLYYFCKKTLSIMVRKAGLNVVALTEFSRVSKQGELWLIARKDIQHYEAPSKQDVDWKQIRYSLRKKTRKARLFAHLENLIFPILGTTLTHKAYSFLVGPQKNKRK